MAAMLSRSGHFSDTDFMKKNILALNEQRNLSRFCDVVLRVCNTEIYAHSNILAAASPYFSSFLGVGSDCPRTFSQKQPQIIEIHIDSVLVNDGGDSGYGEAVSKVVDFMYTTHITLSTTLVTQVIEISKIMLMDKLLEFCYEFQRGINDNRPKDVYTSTSGLQEVFDLLGTRSKIVKRANAATETEETLFAKLKCLSPVTFVDDQQALTVTSSKSTHDKVPVEHDASQVNYIKINPSDDLSFTVPDSAIMKDKAAPNIPSVSVSEPSSVFEEFEKSGSTASLDQDNIDSNNDNSKVHKPLSPDSRNETATKEVTNSEVVSVEVLKSVESINGILNEAKTVQKDYLVVAPGEHESIETDVKQLHGASVISDGDFDSFHTNFKSVSSSTNIEPVSRRGRPRGRGRGKRRGRPPGRPKKVKDPESDPEFDEFMNRLESGDNNSVKEETAEGISGMNPSGSMEDDEKVTVSVANSNYSEVSSVKKEDPDYVPVSMKRKLLSSLEGTGSMWKSSRIRSKPSQLKKDYVLHSWSRKTRKSHDVTSIHECSTVQRQAVKKSTISSSLGKAKNSLRFICQKCDFSTSVFKDYRLHLRTHPETDPRCFLCPKCDFKTTRSREYTTHKNRHMVQEYTCTYCEYQASTSSDFDRHMEKHSGEYPYFCTECASRFKKKNQLMSHRPKHQLEKPFVCAICNAGFKWKHALKNHMITHSTTKDHLCDECGYATAHKSQLKAHKLVHTGQTFKCSMPGCHFEATKRQKLKYHMVTHTHEKPHQCDVCGQRFSLNKNMRRHMLLHTNTRPFACKMCSFTTTRYDKLKEHNFKLHNIGEASVPKKVPVDYLGPNVTYVKSENITLNPDGTFSEEALQTIAQLASSQHVSAADLGLQQTINIEQPTGDGANYPIIARIQYAEVDDGGSNLQYIAEVTENDS